MRAIAAIAIIASIIAGANAARAEVVRSPDGKVVKVIERSHPKLDYAHLKPTPLPVFHGRLPSHIELMIAASRARPVGRPEVFEGGEGNGRLTPVVLVPRMPGNERGASALVEPQSNGGVPPEYGASAQTFTTSRVASATLDPYRRSGQVAYNMGYCSGSLIKRGIVILAAHCTYDWFQRSYFGGWAYTPAYANGTGPYGTWQTYTAYIPETYIDGNSNCSQGSSSCDCSDPGEQCNDDVALLAVQPDSNGNYPGDQTGWFGYSLNDYGYSSGQAQITELGYPSGLDSGKFLERTDSLGVVSASQSNNTIIGSLMDAGSSGGPWIVNFGTAPASGQGVVSGAAPNRNILVGVTSWAYVPDQAGNPLQNGASPLLRSVVPTLLDYACADYPDSCAKPASKK